MTHVLSRMPRDVLGTLAVALPALPFPAILLLRPLRAGDELDKLRVAEQVIWHIAHGSPKDAAAALIWADQPLLHHLLPIPFVLALGPTATALRLPHVLAWIASCVLVSLIAKRLAGPSAGLAAGLLIALSGLFDFLALGLGHGVFTLLVLIVVLALLRPLAPLTETSEQRRYHLGATGAALATTLFATALPVAIAYHALYGWITIRPSRSRIRAIAAFARATWPYAFFYTAYHAAFTAYPLFLYLSGRVPYPIGQFAHDVGRAATSTPNVLALAEDLAGINGYFLPFASWAVLGGGALWMLRTCPRVAVVLAGSVVAVLLFLRENTLWHFLPFFTAAIPFAVAGAWCLFGERWAPWAMTALAGLVAVWSVGIHVWSYGGGGYPDRLLAASFSYTSYRTNVPWPEGAIARDLGAALDDDGYALSFASDTITYHMPGHGGLFDLDGTLRVGHPDSGGFVRDGECLRPVRPDPRVRVVLTTDASGRLCRDLVIWTQEYSFTDVRLESLAH